ncbi:phage holin family protein [Escherichia coli]|nr:phage holin family protein [Escherichia coli]
MRFWPPGHRGKLIMACGTGLHSHLRGRPSLVGYLIILSAGYTAFRIIHGDYMQVDPGEFMLNATVCVAVWLAGGNLAKFVRAT